MCDRVTGEAYHPDGPHPPGDVKETVRAASQGTLAAGARSILTPGGAEVLVGEVPTHEHAVLAVIREGGVALDGVLIQHAATVVALELSQTRLALEHTRRSGAELTAQLIDGRATCAPDDGSCCRPAWTRRVRPSFPSLVQPTNSACAICTSPCGDVHSARRGVPVRRRARRRARTDDALAAIGDSLGPTAKIGASRVMKTVGSIGGGRARGDMVAGHRPTDRG